MQCLGHNEHYWRTSSVYASDTVSVNDLDAHCSIMNLLTVTSRQTNMIILKVGIEHLLDNEKMKMNTAAGDFSHFEFEANAIWSWKG